MILSAFFCFLTGLALEIYWLRVNSIPNDETGFRHTLLVGFVILFAGIILVALVYICGLDQIKVSMDDGWVFLIFVLLGLFLLFAGIFATSFLPRVSERSILIVQFMILVDLFLNRTEIQPLIIIVCAILTILGILGLIFTRTSPFPLFKVFLYFWFLVLLVVQVFLSGDLSYFTQINIGLLESFTFGAVFFFIILHCLILVRFFMIITSLILPRNRRLAVQAIQFIFYDDQTSPLSFFLFMLLSAAVVYLINRYQLPMAKLWINLVFLLIIQVIFNPKIIKLFKRGI
jgi:hypothetical protein